MRVLACVLLLLAAPCVQAQTYKCKDERGRWVFSDKPLPGCAGVPETPGAKSPAPESQQPAKSATPRQSPVAGKALTPSAAAPARTTQKPAAMTRQEQAHATAECQAAREQLEWLLGPRGQGAENRDARAWQLRKALSRCPG